MIVSGWSPTRREPLAASRRFAPVMSNIVRPTALQLRLRHTMAHSARRLSVVSRAAQTGAPPLLSHRPAASGTEPRRHSWQYRWTGRRAARASATRGSVSRAILLSFWPLMPSLAPSQPVPSLRMQQSGVVCHVSNYPRQPRRVLGYACRLAVHRASPYSPRVTAPESRSPSSVPEN
jgi:hypothetical protein